MTIFLIGLIFFVGFFIEGIVGFGGLIISLTLLGLFLDIKFGVLLGIYVVIIASTSIFIRDRKFFNSKLFFSLLPHIVIGGVIGFYLFSILSVEGVKKIFSIIIILLSLQIVFGKNTRQLSAPITKLITMIGGFIQGFSGTGGPLFAYVLQNQTTSAGELRATIALVLLLSACMRGIQGGIQGTIDFSVLGSYWWLGIVIIFSTIASGFILKNTMGYISKKIIGWFLFGIGILLFLQ